MFSSIFSSYLYQKDLNLDLKSIHKHISQTQKKDKSGVMISTEGGWQCQQFKEINNSVKPLFNSLNTAVNEIKNKIGYRHNLKLQRYWYNINYQDSFNMPHTHIGVQLETVVSGVFYVESPKNCGHLIFKRNDPLLSLIYHRERVTNYNEYNSSSWVIIPVKNLGVLFPAYLEHYVEPNLNKGKRISISFNYGI